MCILHVPATGPALVIPLWTRGAAACDMAARIQVDNMATHARGYAQPPTQPRRKKTKLRPRTTRDLRFVQCGLLRRLLSGDTAFAPVRAKREIDPRARTPPTRRDASVRWRATSVQPYWRGEWMDDGEESGELQSTHGAQLPRPRPRCAAPARAPAAGARARLRENVSGKHFDPTYARNVCSTGTS